MSQQQAEASSSIPEGWHKDVSPHYIGKGMATPILRQAPPPAPNPQTVTPPGR